MEIHIQMRLRGQGFPSPDELQLRYELEDALEDQGVGEVVEAGAGGGVMDIFLEVEDSNLAMLAARRMVEAQGLKEITTLYAR